MRLIFFCICATSFVLTTTAQEDESCQLEGVEPSDWNEEYVNDPVDDNIEGTIKEFTAKNIRSANLLPQNDDRYFQLELTDDKTIFKIKPSGKFKDFEKELPSQIDFRFRIRIDFGCADGSNKQLSFHQPINDLNTYEPEFNKSLYSFDLPMPLAKGFEITLFGEEIIVCDYDITNVAVSFIIDPNDKFEMTSLGPINNMTKCHKASIKVKDILRMTENETLIMTSTDIGIPPKSYTAQLNLQVDKASEITPNPMFKNAYYSAVYNDEDEKHTINVQNPIDLERGCEDIELEVMQDNYSNFFKVSCTENNIKVELKENLEETVIENNPVVLVTLQAKHEKAEKPGKTVLVVYLPKQECPEVTTPLPTTACPTPTTIVTTECPEVTCPSATTPGATTTECPVTECPITCPTILTTSPGVTTTDCPVTECPLTCPTISTTLPGVTTTDCHVTECPTTECPVTCPTISTTLPGVTTTDCPVTECPTTECPVTCPTISTTLPGVTTTDCPVTECPTTECPVTCPTISTTLPGVTITDCPVTECPTTECPLTCPTISTTLPGVTTTDCPVTECPTTECPLTFPTISTTLSGVTTTDCPVTECPETGSTVTECPLTCPTIPTSPGMTEFPVTECPLTCPTVSTTTLGFTTCPECSTTCSTTSTEATTCPPCTSTTVTSTECLLTCPTPDLTTACPTALTPTEPPEKEWLEFIKDSFWFDIRSDYIGYVGFVEAKTNSNEEIEYAFDPELGFLEYNKQTGELRKTAETEIKEYHTTAYARGLTSGMQATAEVFINMNDNEVILEVVNTLLTKHIEEEQAHEFALPCQDGQRCVYELKEIYPKLDKEFFQYDSKNNVLNIAKIDREMSEIVNMLVPQLVLDFKLLRSSIQRSSNYFVSYKQNINSTNSEYDDDEKREWVNLPNEIPHRPDQLILTFIIDDINDNLPIFEEGTKLVVGYPVKELAEQMAPPFLVQVNATDKDVGINAEIRYSTDSEYFVIHPKTGVIYPCEDAFDDDDNLKFTVTATDEDGKGHNSTPLHIEVKPVTKDNLIVLRIESVTLEDIDEIVTELSEQTGMTIRYLTAAVLPSLEESKSVFKSTKSSLMRYFENLISAYDTEKDYSTRIVLYGLDTENKTIKSDELEKALGKSEIAQSFSSEEFKVCTKYDGDNDNGGEEDDDYNKAGFIAAISVLASLLVIFIIAAAAFYYFKIYRNRQSASSEPYSTMEEDDGQDSDLINFEKNPRASSVSKSEEIAKRRPTGFIFNPPPIEGDDNEIAKRRATGFVFNPTPIEDEDDKEITKRNPIGFVFNSPPIKEDDEDIFGERERHTYTEPTYVANNELYGTNSSSNIYDKPIDAVDSQVKNRENVSDYLERKAANTADSSTDDSERPKSVKFKETVEKINILVDVPEKQDDDVLDERL